MNSHMVASHVCEVMSNQTSFTALHSSQTPEALAVLISTGDT